jgi:uncharacterized membrane protein (UPF0127 family)
VCYDAFPPRVEIADTDARQARGSMYRTAPAKDRGMPFVYPDEEERSFWMRNTLIPLSIAFMDSEGRVVDIQDMKALDDDPPHYVSAEPAQYVSARLPSQRPGSARTTTCLCWT